MIRLRHGSTVIVRAFKHSAYHHAFPDFQRRNLLSESKLPCESWDDARARVLDDVKQNFAVKDILRRSHPPASHPTQNDADLLVQAVRLRGWY